MEAVAAGIAAGVLGTVVMDGLNLALARTGLIARIDVVTIGRMAAGWTRGRFRCRAPGEAEAARHPRLRGWTAHYLIGIALAVPFVVGWGVLAEGTPPPPHTLAYGIATTAGSCLIVYPALGLGVAGRRSPDGIRAPLSSLANHTFYGLGLAAAMLVV